MSIFLSLSKLKKVIFSRNRQIYVGWLSSRKYDKSLLHEYKREQEGTIHIIRFECHKSFQHTGWKSNSKCYCIPFQIWVQTLLTEFFWNIVIIYKEKESITADMCWLMNVIRLSVNLTVTSMTTTPHSGGPTGDARYYLRNVTTHCM